MTVTDYVKQLRELADFYEAHPTIPLPYMSRVSVFVTDGEKFREVALELGTCEKEYYDDNISLIKKFESGAELRVNSYRDSVCTRKVVGKRLVPSYFVAEHEEDVVEWECGDSILSDKSELVSPNENQSEPNNEVK